MQQQIHVTKIPAYVDGVAETFGTTGAGERNFAYVQLEIACYSFCVDFELQSLL